MTPPIVAVTADEYLDFVTRAVDGMLAIVRQLGDERANARPDLPGANSPFGLLTHCLGVVEYWAGKLVAARPVERDRESEFDATGTAEELAARCRAVLEQLRRDVEGLEPLAPLRTPPDGWALGPERIETQGAALLHVHEELAQHHGQMELLRDLLVAGR
jgi:hypothetical protein